jgi:MFS family permease
VTFEGDHGPKVTSLPAESLTFRLVVVIVVVVFAGGLFGYDQGVISGALPGIKSIFSLSVLMLQVVTSWVTLGALAGSLIAGSLGDAIWRKRTMLLAGALFTLGAAVQSFAPGELVLVAGRLLIGVGVAAVAAPLYAAELAQASLRGRFISSYQLAITLGIFLAYLVNAHLSERQLADDARGGSRPRVRAVQRDYNGPGIPALADDEESA